MMKIEGDLCMLTRHIYFAIKNVFSYTTININIKIQNDNKACIKKDREDETSC